MAQLEGDPSTSSVYDADGLPTLEKWLDEKKITLNLYNNLTKDDPSYNVELLVLMPQNHLFNLKNDFPNVQMTEILQLINLLKKIVDLETVIKKRVVTLEFHKICMMIL